MRARAHSGLRLLRWCGVGALGLVFSVGIPTNIAHAQFGAMVPDQRPIPIEAFYEVLRDYGTWLDTDRYGTVFCPHPDVIGVDFQPYARGHWTMSSEGWTFVSPHKISWATDHYGRWVEVALTNCTWAWLPGSDWSPAWVEFRVSDRVVAWRPKPYGGPPVHMQLPYGVRLPQVSLPPSTFSTDGRDAGFVAVPDNDFTSRRLENVNGLFYEALFHGREDLLHRAMHGPNRRLLGVICMHHNSNVAAFDIKLRHDYDPSIEDED